MYMPTYEYACAACGHQWEQVQRIVEAPIEVCPKCTQASAHRLISGGTNFILKGGGWYSDLYSSSKPPAKSSESANAGGTSDSTTKSEGAAKTDGAAKTETKAAPAASPTPSSSSPAPSSSSASS
jgi:putative FmdB family regulatory protein